MLKIHKASGQFTWTFLPALPLAIGIAIVLGAIYQEFVIWVPFVIMTWFLCVVTGLGIGFISAYMLKKAKCRNPALGFVVAAGVSLFGVLASHGVEYVRVKSAAAAALEKERLTLTTFTVKDYIDLKMDAGWSFSSMPVKGVFVLGVWGLEALVLAASAGLVALLESKKPFCEKCEKWADAKAAAYEINCPTAEALERAKAATSVKDLLVLPHEAQNPAPPMPSTTTPAPDGTTHTKMAYDIRCCPNCGDSFLNVVLTTTWQTSKKKVETNYNHLFNHVCLTAQEAAGIKELARVVTPPAN